MVVKVLFEMVLTVQGFTYWSKTCVFDNLIIVIIINDGVSMKRFLLNVYIMIRLCAYFALHLVEFELFQPIEI